MPLPEILGRGSGTGTYAMIARVVCVMGNIGKLAR